MNPLHHDKAHIDGRTRTVPSHDEHERLAAKAKPLLDALEELIEHEQYAAIQYRHSTSSNSALYDSKTRWAAARAAIAAYRKETE